MVLSSPASPDNSVLDSVLNWANEYILPYWPWIVMVVIGGVILCVIIRKAAPYLIIVAAMVVFSGVGFSGMLTWIRDRGFIDGNWIPW